MKLTILAPALALCGGLALAQNPGTTTSKPQDTKRSSEHKMTAEVVSTDATAQQITVRKLSMGGTTTSSLPEPADAPTFTLKVEGKALTRLSSVKSGDQVTISCKSMSGAETAASAMGGSINSQAVADQHCASVTDISTSKSTR
ncbi:MAG TPA: hypothetical protein VFQ51_09155 [Vicinamibacteria bacterium]|nr:hypothetical protein [Vicinamibacteria bacterium]